MSSQASDFKIGIHTASLLDAPHKSDSVENRPASLLVVPLGKALGEIPHLGVVDGRLATSKQACYSASITFLR